jgi:hypothetical protein
MTDKSKASAAPSAKEQAKTTAEAVKDSAERTGLAAPSTSDVASARAEGVKEAIKEEAKESFKYATDGALPGEPPARQFINDGRHSNIIDGMLALGPDELEAAVAEDAPAPLTEEQVANLLALERNGPNRTLQVKILCKRLKVKSPYEVTHGGPAYTNDVSNVSPVAPRDE